MEVKDLEGYSIEYLKELQRLKVAGQKYEEATIIREVRIKKEKEMGSNNEYEHKSLTDKPLLDRSEAGRIYKHEVELGGVWAKYSFEEFLDQLKKVYTITEG